MDNTEVELRLQIDPDPTNVARFECSKPLVNIKSKRLRLDNVYYDTTDRVLSKHGAALRLRKSGRSWLQTLKIAKSGKSALEPRAEWEVPARMLRGKARLDLTRFADTPLQALLQKADNDKLHVVFRTQVQRVVWQVSQSESLIEVALDRGEISSERKDGEPARVAISEVELELKGGEPIALIELARRLSGDPRKDPVVLIPTARSKAERGYQLTAADVPAAHKASAAGFVAALNAKMSAGEALRRVVEHGMTIVVANVELILAAENTEYVHQARVASRRVRSAVRLLDRDHRDLSRPLVSELRWLARALGAARDWDVMADETLPALELPDLIAAANEQRQRARDQVRLALSSPRYAALVLKLQHWSLQAAPPDKQTLAAMSAPALQQAAKKLFKAARFFVALTPERRHEVRILAKRLRYALDLFAVALPKRATEQYIAALAELQDVLGDLNDAAVAAQTALKLTQTAAQRKAVDAWLAAKELRARDAEVKLAALAIMNRPWKQP